MRVNTLLLASLVSCTFGCGTAAETTVSETASTLRSASTVSGTDASTPESIARTTIGPTETTVTTIPTLDIAESSLMFHIEPTTEDLSAVDGVIQAVLESERRFPIRPGTHVILYSSSQQSIQWAFEKTRELDCLTRANLEILELWVGTADSCGLLVRVDGANEECPERLCKNIFTIAAHELFHAVQGQALDDCTCLPFIWGNKTPNWYDEGTADYVGYGIVHGSNDHLEDRLLSEESTEEFLERLADRATDSRIDVGVIDMGALWAAGPSSDTFGLLYERSFFAIAFLVSRFGEQAVLVDLYSNTQRTGNFVTGFEETFGVSESDFDQQFLTWARENWTKTG